MKVWTSPFSVSAAGVISARLYATICGSQRSIDLTVANGTGASAGTATLTAPAQATLGRGVWTLQLRTDCGCFTLPVFNDACPPPSVSPAGTTGAGGDTSDDSDAPIPTCDATDDTTYCPVFGC